MIQTAKASVAMALTYLGIKKTSGTPWKTTLRHGNSCPTNFKEPLTFATIAPNDKQLGGCAAWLVGKYTVSSQTTSHFQSEWPKNQVHIVHLPLTWSTSFSENWVTIILVMGHKSQSKL